LRDEICELVSIQYDILYLKDFISKRFLSASIILSLVVSGTRAIDILNLIGGNETKISSILLHVRKINDFPLTEVNGQVKLQTQISVLWTLSSPEILTGSPFFLRRYLARLRESHLFSDRI
jgi:hypothetical protein